MNEFETVASIVVICYLIGLICKNISVIKDKIIPCIIGLSGAILGIIGMYVIPEYPASNIMDAIAVGIVSGLAATGVNQVYKQLTKNKEE